MNLKALITSLTILGSSSAAMARPVTFQASAEASFSYGQPVVTVRDHRTTSYPVRYDNRYDWRRGGPGVYHPGGDDGYYQRQPILLSQPLSFGRTEYRKDIIPQTNRRFSHVVIDGNAGTTFVHEVRVQFTDLEWKSITVNERIRGGEQMVLPLDASKSIKRILVYRADGDAAHNLDQRQRGSFIVSAL